MSPHYTEQNFEEHIEEHLVQSGYSSLKSGLYNKTLCLVASQLIEFIRESQPKTFKDLESQYGSDTTDKLLKRVSSEIEKRGVIDVLRKGVKDRGCEFHLVYFEPKSGLNSEHAKLYKLNRLSVIRQLKYSTQNENSLDMGIFVNGIPVITMELKNTLTGQNHLDGEKQYRYDRNPKEPLFRFKRCLVHFSVGNEKVSMTTKLSGEKTRFLPFNRGIVNPVNPKGHKTSYLWESTLQPNSLLDLIENFVHIRIDVDKEYDLKKKRIVERKKESPVFPRFHQLNVINRLKQSIIEEGVGNNYLIQHTTGSGKSLSIGWLSHLLTSLHRSPQDTHRMFDSVLVVTDRRVLDKQIQNTIKQLEQTPGVVNAVVSNSQELKEFIEKGKSIIITTIQKFPVISETISKLGDRRFGVIIDEVHSSQNGETSRHLKKSLSKSMLDEYQEGEETDDLTEIDKLILNQIKDRGKQPHISYFGFSGTPKNKTLELFGRKNKSGQFLPFDTYSMKQSISEGFTLDVLENYTPYKRYFKLNEEIKEDRELPESRIKKMLVKWVDLQPHTIREKTKIILEHFTEHTARKMGGRSRGMVVTKSRLHCIKYKLEFDKQMQELGLPYKSLVGFSGKVLDSDTNREYTESGMNGFPENQTGENLKTPQFRILIVNNKFQTGFDEPLLHTMYVDKKLNGLQCVQTLSRLNRTMTGKTDTMILDFVNDPSIIQESFQPYYQGTLLTEETDPNRLYSIEQEIRKHNLFQDEIVKKFVDIFFDERIPDEELQEILDTVVEEWESKEKEEREEFRSHIQSFIRLYGYVSQIISFKDLNLEKLYIFLRYLNKKLPKKETESITDVLSSIDLEYFRIEKKSAAKIELEDTGGELKPLSAEGGGVVEEPKELLSEIIHVLNESFGGDFTEDDKVNLDKIQKRIMENDELKKVYLGDNTESNRKHKFEEVFESVLLDLVKDNLDFYNKVKEPKRNQYVSNKFYENYSKSVENPPPKP